MNEAPKTIKVDDVEYVRADKMAASDAGYPYVIVRAAAAGCHAGYLRAKTDSTVVLLQSRRLYYWDGAATLSQLAMEGVTEPQNCKFPCVVDEITVANWCEIIPCTEKARLCIQAVPVWQR